MNQWPDHLPSWVFYLVVFVLPGIAIVRMVWQTWGPKSPPSPTRMNSEDVIALVSAAIQQQYPGRDVVLMISDWPRAANDNIWSVRQATIGSWWFAQISDLTGELIMVEHQGVR